MSSGVSRWNHARVPGLHLVRLGLEPGREEPGEGVRQEDGKPGPKREIRGRGSNATSSAFTPAWSQESMRGDVPEAARTEKPGPGSRSRASPIVTPARETESRRGSVLLHPVTGGTRRLPAHAKGRFGRHRGEDDEVALLQRRWLNPDVSRRLRAACARACASCAGLVPRPHRDAGQRRQAPARTNHGRGPTTRTWTLRAGANTAYARSSSGNASPVRSTASTLPVVGPVHGSGHRAPLPRAEGEDPVDHLLAAGADRERNGDGSAPRVAHGKEKLVRRATIGSPTDARRKDIRVMPTLSLAVPTMSTPDPGE